MKSTLNLPSFKLERENQSSHKAEKQNKQRQEKGVFLGNCAMFWRLLYGMRDGFWGGTWPL